MMLQLRGWFSKLAPPRYREQLREAQRNLAEQNALLQVAEQRQQAVESVVARLNADRRRNHYGPTIARALGGQL